MVRQNKIIAITLLVVAALLLSIPMPVLSDQETHENTHYGAIQDIPYDQFMFVQGTEWVYNITYEANTSLIGKKILAYFNSTEVVNNTTHVTFTMITPTYTERQTLSSDIFERKINTLRMVRSDMAMDLAFIPEFVHFDFPLYVGKTWGGRINYSGKLYGYPMNNILDYRLTVLREESVRTSAGQFNTMVIDSVMDFPALHQNMALRIWISDDGIMVRRESYLNGVKVQAIELESSSIPVGSLLDQTMLEASLLKDEVQKSVPENDGKKLTSILDNVQLNLGLEQKRLTQNNTGEKELFLNRASIGIDRFNETVASMDSLDPLAAQRLKTGASVVHGHISEIKDQVE